VLALGRGAAVAIAPFLLEYAAQVETGEAAVSLRSWRKFKTSSALPAKSGGATGKWQEGAGNRRTGRLPARGNRGADAAEVKGFTEFMQRANDSEKANFGSKWTSCAARKVM